MYITIHIDFQVQKKLAEKSVSPGSFSKNRLVSPRPLRVGTIQYQLDRKAVGMSSVDIEIVHILSVLFPPDVIPGFFSSRQKQLIRIEPPVLVCTEVLELSFECLFFDHVGSCLAQYRPVVIKSLVPVYQRVQLIIREIVLRPPEEII